MNQYKHTGEAPSSGVLMALSAGIAAALLLSVPYAYITVYIPFIYLNVLAVVGFGMGIGICISKVARVGMVQSPAVVMLVGIVCACAAEYFNWVAWIFALTRQDVLVFNPTGILHIAGAVLKEGTWGMTGDEPVKGVFLLIVWVIEFGIIIWFAAAIARGGITDWFCCPECKKWFDTATKSIAYELPGDLDGVVSRLKQLDFNALKELRRLDEINHSKFLTLELYFCPQCVKFGCFSLNSIELIQKKKEVETKTVNLIEKVLLPVERLSELIS